jgi:putative NADPH-quinone reductase
MVCTTTGGTRAELEADAHHTATVEQVLRPIPGGVLAFTGMTVLPSFVSYAPASMDRAVPRAELERLGIHPRALLSEP